jgi:hypothetical protein
MIRIQTYCIFKLYRELSLFLHTQQFEMYIYLKKERKEIPLLGKAVPCSWCRIPILSGPLLEVNCLCAPCSPLTPHIPASCQKDIYSCRNKT